MKLPRRPAGHFEVEAAAAEYVRWQGVAGARRKVPALRSFWSRRRDPRRAVVRYRIPAAINAQPGRPTIH